MLAICDIRLFAVLTESLIAGFGSAAQRLNALRHRIELARQHIRRVDDADSRRLAVALVDNACTAVVSPLKASSSVPTEPGLP